MNKSPEMRHRYCADEDCEVCLADSLALQAYLTEQTGENIDHLGKFRSYLSLLGFTAETEHWWPHPTAFDPMRIDFYIQWRLDGAETCRFCSCPVEQHYRGVPLCNKHAFAYEEGFEDGVDSTIP